MILAGICATSMAVVPGAASAATLSSPNGMKTTANTPDLAWSTAENEIATQVRVSKQGAVDGTGQLATVYTTVPVEGLTTAGLTGGTTGNWEKTKAAPLWPGSYFWQVQSATTAPDGTVALAWSEVRKVTVTPYFQMAGVTSQMGKAGASSVRATMTLTAKMNFQKLPMQMTVKLNGHRMCATKSPLVRVGGFESMRAARVMHCKVQFAHIKKGRNSIAVTMKLGSKATTGKIISETVTDYFTV